MKRPADRRTREVCDLQGSAAGICQGVRSWGLRNWWGQADGHLKFRAVFLITKQNTRIALSLNKCRNM